MRQSRTAAVPATLLPNPIHPLIISDEKLMKCSLANRNGLYTSITKTPDGKNLLRTYVGVNVDELDD